MDPTDEETQNAHRVIDQETDNVIVIIDNAFYYGEKGMLKSSPRLWVTLQST